MSQDRSNSPPSNKQKSSVLQAQSVKLLRGIIQVSENAIARIESSPPVDPSDNFAQFRQLGSAILAPIRFLLPRSLSAKLSDLGLTSIIAGLLAVIVWTTTLFSNSPPQVATIPPQPVVNTPELEPAITPEPETVVTIPEPEPAITPEPELTAPTAVEPIEVTPTPEIEATPLPEEIEPTPIPKVELTPEQSLIASIQEQITQQSNSASAPGYGLRISDGSIQSIKANFAGGSLVIQVKDDWYSLAKSEQDKLAQKLLDEAQKLDFTHLKITDSQGTLLARSPVVGKNMIVFQRVAS